MASRKTSQTKKSSAAVPKALADRVKKWNADRARLMKEYNAIQREAKKRGLTTTRRSKR